MNQATNNENIIVNQSETQILKNRLRLKASIDTVCWLTFQACALRGHDETPNSKNVGSKIWFILFFYKKMSIIHIINTLDSSYSSSPSLLFSFDIIQLIGIPHHQLDLIDT
uniref:Uncharacterized protein n=1 Tax=Lactuca sativa TaxID=4236 RepID=A0A9R1WC32_LACSA|nr:hypothetical protein LSAT_V11C200095880 [Lactuca sativa]